MSPDVRETVIAGNISVSVHGAGTCVLIVPDDEHSKRYQQRVINSGKIIAPSSHRGGCYLTVCYRVGAGVLTVGNGEHACPAYNADNIYTLRKKTVLSLGEYVGAVGGGSGMATQQSS